MNSLIEIDARNVTVLSSEGFAERIRAGKSELVASFLGIVRALVPAASDTSHTFLKDHLPEQVDSIVEFLRENGGRSTRDRLRELAAKHGEQRSTDPDYSVRQILKEHNILRSVLINLLQPTEALGHGALSDFGEITEVMISSTVIAFVQRR